MTDVVAELFRAELFQADLLQSVEHIWLLWVASVVATVWLGRRLYRDIASGNRPRRSWRELHACEDGVAYTLSYMISIPLFAFIICLVTDTTLILVTKTGTVYAAYAAARSAVVWNPSGVSSSTAKDKVETAALHAMTPFGSSSEQHRPISVPPSSGLVYLAAHKAFADKPAPLDYLGWKYQYASWATDVKTDGGTNPTQDVTTTIQYKAPFHMPGIGRLLGTKSVFGFYYMNITTTVKLESQAPRNEQPNPANRPLGISYVPSVN